MKLQIDMPTNIIKGRDLRNFKAFENHRQCAHRNVDVLLDLLVRKHCRKFQGKCFDNPLNHPKHC